MYQTRRLLESTQTHETIITDFYVDIKKHRNQIDKRRSHLKQCEANLEVKCTEMTEATTNLEEKWTEMTKAITKYNRRTKASRTPSEDQEERIENQV